MEMHGNEYEIEMYEMIMRIIDEIFIVECS